MNTETDRFFAVVCCCALAVTVAVVLWTHQVPAAFGRQAELASAATGPPPAAPAASPITDDPAPARPATGATGSPPTAAGAAFASNEAGPGETASPAWHEQPLAVARVAEVVHELAAGQTPWLGEPALPEPAEVLVYRDRDGRTLVAPGTHRRYDHLAAAVAALDPADLAALVESFEEEISAELASLDGDQPDLRAALGEAVNALLAVALTDAEPDMISRGSHWGFADPEYEGLSAAQKHLLLMGRDNARTVRAALTAFSEALDLSPAETGPAMDHTPFAETLLAANGIPSRSDEPATVTAP